MFIGFTLIWTGAIVFMFFWPAGVPMMIIGVLWFVGAAVYRLVASADRAVRNFDDDDEEFDRH